MDSCYRTMSALVDTFDLSRIESNLIQRKNDIVQASSWMMNIVMLVLVACGFSMFLYIQYHATAKEEEETKRIPFEPIPWLSATRNVRMEEYGRNLETPWGRQLQSNETQIGYGIPGPTNGDSFSSVYGDYTSRAARD